MTAVAEPGFVAPGCPDLSAFADLHLRIGDDPASVGDDVLAAVREGIAAHPRTAQVELGPSELGHPCNRWLAYRFAGVTPTGLQNPPWRQSVGTFVHEGFADLLHRWNAEHGLRWLSEVRVHVGDLYPGRPIYGTADAVDLVTRTVVDLKVPGPSAMKTYGPGKPESPQYEVQTDLYGCGVTRAGLPVQSIGILRLPAAGELGDAVWRHRPHDPGRAHAALERAGGIARMVDTLGPAAIGLQPTTQHYCQRCPFFAPRSENLTRACPGDPGWVAQRDARPDPLAELVGGTQ